jgi:hypothetical protein
MDRHSSKGQTQGAVNQHKRMAEGEKVTGMKRGGKVHSDEKADKKLIKETVKPSALKMKQGGMACKEGGHIKKRGK